MKTVFVSLSCLVCALSAALPAQNARTESKTCTGRWSPPFPVQRADGRPVYIERGLITSFADQTLALGSPTFFWLGRNHIAPPEALTDTTAAVWSFTRAGALIDAAGTAVGVPMVDTLHPRKTPRLIAQDSRAALVAWAAADSVSSLHAARADAKVIRECVDSRVHSAALI